MFKIRTQFGSMALAVLLLMPAQAVADANTISQEAKSFVTNYWTEWSQTNTNALSYLPTVIEDPIIFYGKSTPLKSFIEIQTAFVDRWPSRNYTLQPDSLVTSCNQDSSSCQISGVVNWITDSPARKAHSVGSANFQFTVSVRNSAGKDQFLIAEESGSVISRTLTTGNAYVPQLPTQSANNTNTVPNDQPASGGSSESGSTISTVPPQPAKANPPNALTFSDPQGIAYANLGETTWSTNRNYNEMTDQTDISVVSTQQNNAGATAQVTGTCSNGVVTFTATITDTSGQATVNLTNETDGEEGAPSSVEGELRINSLAEFQNSFSLSPYNNTPLIIQLELDGSPGNAFSFGDKLDLATTWRILAQLDTDHGTILIKIPLYDPQIESFLKSCVSENAGPDDSSSAGYLGVSTEDIPENNGAMIAAVMADGPASTGGLQSGDIITRVNGQTITSSADLHNDIGNILPGQTACINFMRGGQSQVIFITLGKRPAS